MKYVLFIMPFGTKTIMHKTEEQTAASVEIDFDKRFDEIKKEYSTNELSVHRVDYNMGTDIYSKMYKMIASADVVVADITGCTPNVMYELGARHSLKHKRTIMYRSDIDNNIPFDINTFAIHNYDYVFSNLLKLIKEEDNDSPILKELTKAYDRSIFDGYESKWEKFVAKYSLFKEGTDDSYAVLEEYRSTFEGAENYDQKRALCTYKRNEGDLESLMEAMKIIEVHNPSNSNNHETIGLSCSISRKIYELTENEKDKMRSFDYSRRFIALFKTSYSVSSYAMHLLAEAENSKVSIEYIEEEANRIKSILDHIDTSVDTEYFKHTKILVSALSGQKTDEYNRTAEGFAFETSKEAYLRAIAAYEKLKKIQNQTSTV